MKNIFKIILGAIGALLAIIGWNIFSSSGTNKIIKKSEEDVVISKVNDEVRKSETEKTKVVIKNNEEVISDAEKAIAEAEKVLKG